MSTTVLDRILLSTRDEVERRKRAMPLQELLDRGALAGVPGEGVGRPSREGVGRRPFREAITRPGIAVIAEFKRRSPSAGPLGERPDLREVVGAYTRGGASALSILTEGPNFDGSLDDLREAHAVSGLPILRKDFILDSYQLHEARLTGAAAVLLIVAALDQPTLATLYGEARALGLDVLVEVHDGPELQRALELGAELIGINNRDLRDFTVDVERTFALLEEVPGGVAVVSESGITDVRQLLRLQEQGVQAVLVGETLMRSPDPEAALRGLRGFRDAEVQL
jgi:indole-3-glycerol phosphate synthase